MSKVNKVLITQEIPEEGLIELRKYCNVDMKSSISQDELFNQAPELDGILSVGTEISAEFLKKAKNLKIISNYGVGYDNVDIVAAASKKIPVTNLPFSVTESTAELTVSLMLALSRRIVEADKFIRQNNNHNWHPMLLLGNELYGKKIGIIGFGRIGKAVAKRANAFGMDVYYYDINPVENEEPLSVKYAPLDQIYGDMDYITLHLPYTKDTHHIINMGVFEKMKKTTYIINASRGPIIDQKALIDVLRSKRLAGAALDVFEEEPYVPDELTDLANVVLTPHIGTSTIETRVKMAQEASKNILKIFNGELPANVVNRYMF